MLDDETYTPSAPLHCQNDRHEMETFSNIRLQDARQERVRAEHSLPLTQACPDEHGRTRPCRMDMQSDIQ